MAKKVIFKIACARARKQHNKQQRAYQRILTTEKRIRDIDQEEAINKYQHSIGEILEKFNIFDDVEVLARLTLIEIDETENLSLLSNHSE